MNNQLHRRLDVAIFSGYVVESLSTVALWIVAAYRLVLSPVLFSWWGPACRFEPTCSAYAAEAITRYGIGRGGWMALRRLAKCRPLGGWGFDPLPPPNFAKQP